MRKHLILMVTLAVIASTSVVALPTAHGQGFLDDLVNELENIIDQATQPNSQTPPPSTSRPLAAGTMMVEANTGWTSDALSPNTTIDIQGKRWKLPVGFNVDANGNVSVMPRSNFPTGNRVRISNGSANDFYFGFTEWSANPRPNSPPATSPGPSNNAPAIGTGSVTVVNRSSNSITVRFALPRGYFYGPNNYSSLWQSVGAGGSDTTRNLATKTKVTIDGYNGQEFYVRRQDETRLIVTDDGIAEQAAGSSLSAPNPGGGSLPNQVAVVNAGTSWRSGSFPAGTRAQVGGSGVSEETTYKLPASVVVFADGGQAELSFALSGTFLDIKNNSQTDVIVKFLPPPNSSTPGNAPPPTTNQVAGDTGNIRLHNQSGKSITARYALPAGKRYAYGGASHSSLYVNLDDGDTDVTPRIAAGTRVTVDGYPGKVFVVRRNDDLDLNVFANEIGQSAASSAPSPPPAPRPLSDNDSSPNAPAPAAPQPVPSPQPNSPTTNKPKPPSVAKPNPSPGNRKPKTTPLTSVIAQSLTKRVNEEVDVILSTFDKASSARVAALKVDLDRWGLDFGPGGTTPLTKAAIDGNTDQVIAIFESLQLDGATGAEPFETIIEPLAAIATFRTSLLDLQTKISAGQATLNMMADFKAMKQLAERHESKGLAQAVTLIQQDLLIRDQINRAAVSSVLAPSSQAPPTGNITIVRHPWIEDGSIYLGNDGLLLTRATDDNIFVAQATIGGDSAASPTINSQVTLARPTVDSLKATAGSKLFDFGADEPAPAAPTAGGDLLDLLKAVE